MSILLVAPDSVGIIPVIVEHMKLVTQQQVYTIDLDKLRSGFRYKNKLHRIRNFFSKIFLKKNLKHTHFYDKVTNEIKILDERFETIITIRPDLLSNENLSLLKTKANYFVAYYWDSIPFFPRKAEIIHYFDKVYSFDDRDCKKYKLEQLTNFYFYQIKPHSIEYKAYNLSTLDNRITILQSIAAILKRKNISYLFKAYSPKNISVDLITTFDVGLNYKQMLEEVSKSSCMVDVQRDEQYGLTFRPFEALGLDIKLITTNEQIRNYDFYDENNILVIDKNNIQIPDWFFNTPYKMVPQVIKEKYYIDFWVKKILKRPEA